MEGTDPDVIRGIERVTGETFDAETGQWTLTATAQVVSAPSLAGAGTFTTTVTMDIEALIRETADTLVDAAPRLARARSAPRPSPSSMT